MMWVGRRKCVVGLAEFFSNRKRKYVRDSSSVATLHRTFSTTLLGSVSVHACAVADWARWRRACVVDVVASRSGSDLTGDVTLVWDVGLRRSTAIRRSCFVVVDFHAGEYSPSTFLNQWRSYQRRRRGHWSSSTAKFSPAVEVYRLRNLSWFARPKWRGGVVTQWVGRRNCG